MFTITDDQYYPFAEVAKLLGVSEKTVWRALKKKGMIPSRIQSVKYLTGIQVRDLLAPSEPLITPTPATLAARKVQASRKKRKKSRGVR